MKVDGLHHVTAITADIEANLNFYGRLLGLRLVWQGVNADDPEMRHVAHGDERGSPGSIVTLFDMPGVAPGRPGSGMAHRLLLRVADAKALDFWERRLARAGVAADRMADRLLAGMFVAAFVGLSLPVVGVGITLSRHVSPKDTILGFAIAVSVGIAASAIKLVGRTTPRAGAGPTAAGRGADSLDGKPGHQPIDKPKERRAP
jgi:catechol 2,3-dioxygenase-like lactoylglutathione lyase family enzyme